MPDGRVPDAQGGGAATAGANSSPASRRSDRTDTRPPHPRPAAARPVPLEGAGTGRGGETSETDVIEILLVEDSPGDAHLVREWLREAFTGPHRLHRVSRLSEAKDHLLEHGADCVLLDLVLPDSVGLDSVSALRVVAADIPLVVMSALGGERTALAAMHHGAQDYLLKDRVDGELLSRAIRYAIERKRAELQISHQALHDPLTDAANRALLTDRLAQAVAALERSESSLAVYFLDLDHFKRVNDSHGHEAGDELLVALARRLEEALRPTDTVARIGGDEFVVLCTGVASRRDVFVIAERLQAAVAEPFALRDTEVRITVSVGIAVTESGDAEPAKLLRDADAAMYRAKDLGRARWELFDVALWQQVEGRLGLERDLRSAVDHGEFRVHYQPVVDLATGRVEGAEALVRWQAPSGELVVPGAFLAVAEESGLMPEIGSVVLTGAAHRLASWANGSALVAVNLSPRELMDPALLARIDGVLEATGADPRRLCIEITEHALIDPDTSQRVLQALKDRGVRLSIDDFGTGYSSLNYLKRFPFDILKIDRSFVDGLGADAHDAAIVQAIVVLAHALELVVVAEGVETAPQAQYLRELGCDLCQGFYFARPGPADVLPPPGTVLGRA
jgi:diguanylate cyclase (GGDEF)-like protein